MSHGKTCNLTMTDIAVVKARSKLEVLCPIQQPDVILGQVFSIVSCGS